MPRTQLQSGASVLNHNCTPLVKLYRHVCGMLSAAAAYQAACKVILADHTHSF